MALEQTDSLEAVEALGVSITGEDSGEPHQIEKHYNVQPNLVRMQKKLHDQTVNKEKSSPVKHSMLNMQSKFSLANTPVNLNQLKKDVANYPNTAVSDELIQGFEFGFPLHYTSSTN